MKVFLWLSSFTSKPSTESPSIVPTYQYQLFLLRTPKFFQPLLSVKLQSHLHIFTHSMCYSSIPLVGTKLSQLVQAATTKHHRQSGLNNTNLSLTLLEGVMSKIQGASNRSEFSEGSFLACRQPPYQFVLTWPFFGLSSEVEKKIQRKGPLKWKRLVPLLIRTLIAR